jgi:hypothetical protein
MQAKQIAAACTGLFAAQGCSYTPMQKLRFY